MRPSPKTFDATSPRKWKQWFPALLIFVAVVAAFSPAFFGTFILDDDLMLTKSPLMQGPLSAFWITAKPIDYFPLTYTSLWLEWRLWGADPIGYHVTNVLLHALSCIILWRVFVRFKLPAAWLAALLFAVHPVNVESVAWVAERKNVLAMLFYAITAWSFIRFVQSGDRRFYVVSGAAFVLSLLAKPAVVAWPAIALGILWLNRKGPWTKMEPTNELPSGISSELKLCLRWVMPLLLPVIVLGPITVWFQSHHSIGSDIKFHHADLLTRIVAGGVSIWFYIWKALVPAGLTLSYPLWDVNVHSILWWLPWLGLVALGAIVWRRRNSECRPLLIALAYFFLILTPVLGIFDMASHRYCYVSDRWQYFALPAVMALVAAALHKWKLHFKVGIGLVVVFAFLTFQQSLLYRDAELLWSDALRKNPSCWLAYNALGYLRQAAGRNERAVEMYQESLRIHPDQAEAHSNIADALLETGKVDEAIAHTRQAIEIDPDYAMAYYNLGCSLRKKGDFGGSIDAFQQAIRRRDDWGDAHYNLAWVLQLKGDAAAAESEYRKAISCKSGFVAAYNNLGALLCSIGRREEAIAELRNALAIAPSNTDALLNLGETLVESRKPEEALPYLQKAVATNPNRANPHASLGNALMALKQSSSAKEQFEVALQYDPQNELALYGMAACLRRSGQTNEAVQFYDQLLNKNPRHAEAHYQLALLLLAQQQDGLALEHLRESVRLKPDWFEAVNGLARYLATSSTTKPIESAEAIRLGQRAVELTAGQNAVALDTLGIAWARNEVFTKACEAARQALQLAEQNGNGQLAKDIRQHLELYNHRLAYER